MFSKILVLCCVLLSVTSQRRRQGRFFSFNFEEQDITVDLDFSIPFLSIPIKKTTEAFGFSELPTININPASLMLGGAVVLGTTVALPLFMKHYASTSPDYRVSRLIDTAEFGSDGVISYATRMLADGNGIRGCALKIACWTAQRRDENLMRVVSRITSNQLMSAFINSTAVEDAMLSGRSGRDCATYQPCPFQEQNLPLLLQNLSVLGKSYGL